MLFKYKEFKQGIEFISKLINKKQELLNIYMLNKEYQKIIDMCNISDESGISSIGIILNYFLDKKLRSQLDESGINEINEYLKKLLEKILDDNLLLPISVLNIINEKNNEIPVEILNFFIEKSIEKQLDNLELSSKNINMFTNEINTLNSKMTEINTNAMNLSLNRCDECDLDISFPCRCYKCGHNYHPLCINANVDPNVECPKCKKNKMKKIEELKNIENYGKFINNKINFEEEYEKSEDKIDFILSLYGKGLFAKIE